MPLLLASSATALSKMSDPESPMALRARRRSFVAALTLNATATVFAP